MRINKDSLSARVLNIAKEKGISANVVYSRYFFDCFLKRLSLSPYSEKFILKGGLFLSSVLGIENRATMDIDFIVRKIRLERVEIVDVIKEICKVSADDNVSFLYIGDSEIKKDDIYGGFSISILKTSDNDLISIWPQQISCIHRIKIMNINVLLPERHFILRAIPLRVSSLRRCKHSSLGVPSTAGRRIYMIFMF